VAAVKSKARIAIEHCRDSDGDSKARYSRTYEYDCCDMARCFCRTTRCRGAERSRVRGPSRTCGDGCACVGANCGTRRMLAGGACGIHRERGSGVGTQYHRAGRGPRRLSPNGLRTALNRDALIICTVLPGASTGSCDPREVVQVLSDDPGWTFSREEARRSVVDTELPGLHNLRVMSGTKAPSPAGDGEGAARVHQLRALGLTADSLGRNELGSSSW
jgi:hypothetical protein